VALVKIEQALAHEPEHAALLRTKAVIQRALGRVEAARASLDRPLSLDAGDPATLVALGKLELDMRRVDAAARLAREALEQAPDSVDALVLQGHVLLQRGQIDDAREHALWALRANSGDSEALRVLVVVKVRQNPLLGLWRSRGERFLR
jgi:tetratricopeptide (TPR) repeat protein